MPFTISYVRKPGRAARSVQNYDMDEAEATAFCAELPAHKVVLTFVDDEGLPTILGTWEKGRRRIRQSVVVPLPPEVIEGEVALPVAMENMRAAAAQIVKATEGIDGLTIEADEDEVHDHAPGDDTETYGGYCVKCKQGREFVGHVEEMANGRRAAKGTCPVCGTKMTRILSNLAKREQEEFHTPDDDPDAGLNEAEPVTDDENPDDNPDVPGLAENAMEEADAEADTMVGTVHVLQRDSMPRGMVRLFCSADDWEKTVRPGTGTETRALAEFSEHEADYAAGEPEEVWVPAPGTPVIAVGAEDDENRDEITVSIPEGTPVAEVAEATATAALEFSDAAAEVEAPVAPRKRQGAKKATAPKRDADGRTPNQRAAANPKQKTCPDCQQPVDVIQRAGIDIFTLHGDAAKGLERCKGSTTVA